MTCPPNKSQKTLKIFYWISVWARCLIILQTIESALTSPTEKRFSSPSLVLMNARNIKILQIRPSWALFQFLNQNWQILISLNPLFILSQLFNEVSLGTHFCHTVEKARIPIPFFELHNMGLFMPTDLLPFDPRVQLTLNFNMLLQLFHWYFSILLFPSSSTKNTVPCEFPPCHSPPYSTPWDQPLGL